MAEGPPAALLTTLIGDGGAGLGDAVALARGLEVALGLPGARGALYAHRRADGAFDLAADVGGPFPWPAVLDPVRDGDTIERLHGGLEGRLEAHRTGAHAAITLLPCRLGPRTVGALAAPESDLTGPGGTRGRVVASGPAFALALERREAIAGLRERADRLDRRAEELAALTAVAQRVERGADRRAVAEALCRECQRLLGADVVAVYLRDEDDQLVLAADSRGGGLPGVPTLAEAAVRRGLEGPVWMGRELAVPMSRGADDHPSGAGLVALARREGRPLFDDDSMRQAVLLATQGGLAVARADLIATVEREQAERRRLAAALARVQEGERRRIAEDLHDGPVQELVGVGLLLDGLAGDLRRSAPAAVGDVERVAGSAREAVRALRRAIADLHPLALDERGLRGAVGGLAERLGWHGVTASVDLAAAEGLASDLRTTIFRICQEAVANIIRHADARTAEITAHRRRGTVVIEVRDDGRGFDPGQDFPGASDGHLGLASMRERALLAGISLTIDSSPGLGSVVRLSIPMGSGEASVAT